MSDASHVLQRRRYSVRAVVCDAQAGAVVVDALGGRARFEVRNSGWCGRPVLRHIVRRVHVGDRASHADARGTGLVAVVRSAGTRSRHEGGRPPRRPSGGDVTSAPRGPEEASREARSVKRDRPTPLSTPSQTTKRQIYANRFGVIPPQQTIPEIITNIDHREYM